MLKLIKNILYYYPIEKIEFSTKGFDNQFLVVTFQDRLTQAEKIIKNQRNIQYHTTVKFIDAAFDQKLVFEQICKKMLFELGYEIDNKVFPPK